MIGIKKLDIFILKQFGLLLVGTFFICQFVLMMQFLWRFVDELIGKGLSLEVLAQFFWYMGLMLMPQAFPLAILLSSLIAFGNLGESSELTAIKAAGVSLMQTFRPLVVLVTMIACMSFYFQNVVGPEANKSFYRLLLSMKQKSPELEIPEGIFYNGIPGTNLYVQKKDLETGKLYGIMIYRMNGGYEDQAIILADSGMLQSTAEQKHLVLTLYSGEWFENMRSQQVVGGRATVPYRRETFVHKKLVLDFDGGLNMVDVAGIASDARAKGLSQLISDIDSINLYNDSIGRAFYDEAFRMHRYQTSVSGKDSLRIAAMVEANRLDLDSAFAKRPMDIKRLVTQNAMSSVKIAANDVGMRKEYCYELNRNERKHEIEAYKKFTLSLSCLIFFFIGAPLGAIIRKGGLGLPVIISVLVYILYYIFDFSGMKMARDGHWTVWFGELISSMVLVPIACFFTYKANKESTVFNVDLYVRIFQTLFGLRRHRHIYKKEVIITDPDYRSDVERLKGITEDIVDYNQHHRLMMAPNPIKVFFRPGDDHAISGIADRLEAVIEDLQNSKDPHIISLLNDYPILLKTAHTRLFRQTWLNALSGIILPVGIVLYLRMWRFRLRLLRDLRTIRQTSDSITERITDRWDILVGKQ